MLTAPLIQRSPDVVTANRQGQDVSAQAAALNATLDQSPEYQAYLYLLHSGASEEQLAQAAQAIDDQFNTSDDGLIFDPYTAQFRTKNWDENNNALSALTHFGEAAGTGLAAGAALGAFAAPVAGAATADAADTAGGSSVLTGEIPDTSAIVTGGGGRTLSGIGAAFKDPNTLRGIGQSISNAASAAGNVQRANLDTNAGTQDLFQREMVNLAKEEASQRQGAEANVARESMALNPRVSPYDPAGPQTMSPAYLNTLKNLSSQGQQTLAQPAQYSTTKIPAPVKLPPAQNSTLQNVGEWVGPGLTTLGYLSKFF